MMSRGKRSRKIFLKSATRSRAPSMKSGSALDLALPLAERTKNIRKGSAASQLSALAPESQFWFQRSFDAPAHFRGVLGPEGFFTTLSFCVYLSLLKAVAHG